MFDGMMDEHDENGIEPAAPATQHRVIPVEWHRVAIEPTCELCGGVVGPTWCPGGAPHGVHVPTDDAPARVEPTEKCLVCDRAIFFSTMVHSWVHADWLKTQDLHQAQPANTDDRQADTIPDDLKERYEQVVDAISSHPDYWLCREWKRERAYIERIARLESEKQAAETRIEVLEAALRRHDKAALAMDSVTPNDTVKYDGSKLQAATWLALAAPSGEKEKV